MIDRWEGKITVITGASGGIGASLARKLAARGAVPVLLGRSEDRLNKLAAELGGACAVYQMNVQDGESVDAVVEQIIRAFGRIDLWVNNAGYGVFARFVDATVEQFADMMDVNYLGVVRCTKAVLPHMLAARSGHIVNIASLAGKVGTAKSSGYSATKHAVLGLTNSLRPELAGTGVGLTAVNPGPVETGFFDTADPSGSYVKNVQWMMLKPDYVAEKVLQAVERNRVEVNLPFSAGAMAKLYLLFPRMLDRIASRVINRK